MAPVAVQVDLPMEAAFGRHQHQRALNAVLLFTVTINLGYLGWVLPSVGGSLAIPTLIVLGIGCAIAVGWWISFRDWAVVIAVIAITIGASVWTFAFSLPTSLAWDSGATVQVQRAVALTNAGPKRNGIPQQPCTNILTGHIGALGAPYSVCVDSPSLVTFTSMTRPFRGYSYTDQGAAFPDECSKHLFGKWWMFVADVSGIGDCPIGYQFHGGP
jgi:hypothetical protein